MSATQQREGTVGGIRIQHPTKRSTTFTVVDSSRPYRAPITCGANVVVHGELRPCGRVHVFKTYHLNLDETGAVIVSHEIVGRLERIPGNPFVQANEVRKPPTQIIRPPRLIVRTVPVAVAERS